jgi:two-component system NtrC family sensor kinase
MYGYSRDEFIGMTGKDFVDPKYYHKFEDFKTQVMETGRFRADSKDIRKDGTAIYVDVKGTMFNYRGKPHLLAVNSDITERKQAEKTIRETNRELQQALKDLKATQTHLVQSEKMATLGRLVAGVSHEFNNPIGAVRSSNSNLKTSIGKLESLCVPIVEDVAPKKKTLEKLMTVIRDANQVIEEGTDRVATIVQRMKSFARLDEADWQLSDLHQCIEDSLHSLPRGWDERIMLTKEFGTIPKVGCYPAQVNQVLHNVLNNAVEAIKGKGEILIATVVVDDGVVIRVKDSGRGISEKDLGKIFDPGYTTKSRGVGTGLGLAIGYQIMQEHQGAIEVDSELGQGTEVRLRFPTGK